jgi:hypothetical protein
MKKFILILLVFLVLVSGLSCSGLISGSNTSLVTITVGSDQTALIKAVPATMAARITRFFAKSFHTPSAVAAIPAVVATMRITVSAPDMQTITLLELVAGQSSIAFFLEIPNGKARNFLLEGRDITNAVAYWNEFSLDLKGGQIAQAVDMLYIGSATSYLFVDVSGNDANTGTKSSPLRTITRALTVASVAGGNTAIFIEPGTYTTGEGFPLGMGVNNSLVGLGPNFTTVIDSGTSSAVTGTSGVLNGCRINTSNNPGASISASAALTIIGDLISGATPIVSSVCISVPSGNPRIAKSTITGCTTGINVTGGSPTIEFNTILGNVGAGVSISNVGGTVTNNTIHNNATGVFVSGSTATPVINYNSIYCNTTSDVNASGTITPIIATLNSWDHDLTTTPTGPTTGVAGCPAGTDICPGTAFTYTPFNAAVPGACL